MYKDLFLNLKGDFVATFVVNTQGLAKTQVFHQKPSPVGLTDLNQVLMGLMD